MLGALIEGALGGRRKRSHGALRYLTGGGGSIINAGTLLTAAGLAWGAYEAATRQGASAPAGPAPAGPVPPVPVPSPPQNYGGTLPPPPPLPPLPGHANAPALPADLLRAVRLAISAARVDGSLAAEERELIVAKAREVGAEQIVDQEIMTARPLAEIVKGVTDPQQCAELYGMAFAIVRADETVSGTERIYLAQLAHHLGLDPADTHRLETEVAAKIDAEGQA
jgi:uncharacterized membrane protein YebE (DUF533 family)